MAEERQTPIQAFLARLKRCVDQGDRGTLADLRHGFSPATEHRAWPHLAAWGVDLRNDTQRAIWITVAAGFATLNETKRCGNMGATMRRLAQGGEGKQADRKALESFEGRFRRLLTCTTRKELCSRLQGVVRAAKQKGAQIDLEQLFWDLECWPVSSRGRDVRIEWAQAYWGVAPADKEMEGLES